MQRARIVVAEDEAGIRQLMEAVLGDEGYDVRAAGDGLAALALIRSQQPDLVLLDIAMPNLNGDAVLRQLRSEGSSVPVIIVTAGPVLPRWRQEGEVFILAKPFPLEELIALVAAVLARRPERGL